MISFEMSIDKWLSQLNVDIDKVQKHSESIFKEAVSTMYYTTVNNTPIGRPELWHYPAHKNYTPGTLKASWEVEFKGNNEAIISNKAPYAQRVEYGWSSQAPDGMLRKAIAQYPIIIESITSKYI